ncbi:hypothetical protein LSAT2_017453, partial [Lamellibrachia satsuma]
ASVPRAPRTWICSHTLRLHGHRHFITYHPDLMDGQTFYVHIEAVNRTGRHTVQVTGPILVQVGPPVFSGNIAVSVQEHDGSKYLVGRWDRAGFSARDLQDALIYRYSYGVGHSRATDSIKEFVSLTQASSVSGLCTWTEPPTCVAIPLSGLQWNLHGRHSYYMSLKLEGINALDRVASSDVYEHYRGPPYGGVVVELPLNTVELLSEDIDHQANQSQLQVAWHSFHHIDQVITYQLALGTKPGYEDISSYIDVTAPSQTLTDLVLQPFKTYYASVRARTLDGSMVVSSDGVTILPVDTLLEGVEVLDALPCSTEFRELTDAGCVTYVIAMDLFLSPGQTYRAVVQFCHQDGCFLPLYSDGVTITPDAPVSSGLTSASLTEAYITFIWSHFVDPSASLLTAATDVISRREWSLQVQHGSGHSPDHLYNWQLMAREDVICQKTKNPANHLCSYTANLAAPLETSSCVVLVLRVYNKVGLYSTVTHQLRGCDVASKVRLTVMDAVASTVEGNILLEKNALWPKPDQEYTMSSSTLSAVWPDLRHGTYHWKVVSDDAIQRFAYIQPETAPDYKDYDCSAPEVMACGETRDNFMNVHGLALKEGQHYHICILANATDLQFEKFTQHLEQNSECSNGIIVDRTPPITGQVWVGSHQKHWSFQIDRSQLNIYWSSFVDIEAYGRSSHHSGILKYEYAIGTSPEGVDTCDYVEVGVTNMAVTTGLTLHDGQTYYVTVRATDHVGRSTTAVSPGVTVDTTPPDVSAVLIDMGRSYVTERTELSAGWKGVFTDVESGIERYYWCLGSKSGYCDTVSYVETTEPEGSQSDLRLTDGHPVYVSVQAVNRVDLTAVTTSRAVIVDASPPIAGHVYDVTTNTQTTDTDYMTMDSEIGAVWAGFHDPHSHITGYNVNIGKCPECEDILEKSHVGITTSVHLSDVTLEHGVTYYTTVEACNGAGLCVTVTSDGIIVDTSPPVAGVLFDGIGSNDIEYQSSRSLLSSHWLNFHDPESGLLSMESRAGTSPGQGDILVATGLHVTDEMTTNLSQPLPLGRKVYITLKVYNKAGLSTESSSDGFIVDNTSPVTVTRIALDNRIGSLKPGTQMLDPESSVVEQFVSLTTRNSIHHNVPAVKLHGDEQTYTFSNVSLVDGETYYAKVIACNGARLCTTSVSEGILVGQCSLCLSTRI